MDSISYETRLSLAIQAIKKDNNLSTSAAAKLYNIRHKILRDRLAGRYTYSDLPANSRKLIDLEEKVIIQYVLDLITRSFLPLLSGIEDIANQLLRIHDALPVGKL
jgi:hypothetical protein